VTLVGKKNCTWDDFTPIKTTHNLYLIKNANGEITVLSHFRRFRERPTYPLLGKRSTARWDRSWEQP